ETAARVKFELWLFRGINLLNGLKKEKYIDGQNYNRKIRLFPKTQIVAADEQNLHVSENKIEDLQDEHIHSILKPTFIFFFFPYPTYVHHVFVYFGTEIV
ncbi:hypothetical protein ACJX0J_013835, partial [Zea mays]